jgi:hypothetical protein
MIRRFAVEIYLTMFVSLLALTVVWCVQAIKSGQAIEFTWLKASVLPMAVAFGVMALQAATVRLGVTMR